jgi:ribosomal protein L16 Arg81 hydroxylase
MLPQLLHPYSLATFLSEYWEKQPLYVARPLPEWCREMPSLDDLDAIISHTSAPEGFHKELLIRSDGYGVENYTVERGPDGRADMSAIYRAYAKGWTIVVYNMHRRWNSVARLASGVASEIGHDTRVNLYCTPSDSRGFKAHADSHEVFLLQLEGRKSWRIFAPQYESPLEPQEVVVKQDELGDPLLEVTTEPGQILYLPRGYIHEAERTSAPSMHLTISIHPLRWLDLLEAGLRAAAERDARFRRTAPSLDSGGESLVDNVSREFAALLETVKGREIAQQALTRALGDRNRLFRTSPDPHFNAIEQARSLSASSAVVRRLGLRTRVVQKGQRVSIEFGTRSVSAPLNAASALEFVSEHRGFRVDELPGELSEKSKIALVRRLIHEGLLKITTEH